MKKQPGYFFLLLAVATLSFASCKNSVDYRKTKSGLMYKIFSNGKDSVVKNGNIMKIDFTIKVGSSDSVLQTSVGRTPVFIPIQDVPGDSYSQLEVFNMLRKGDSAVIVQLIDTILKKSQQPMPPFFKKGDKLITLVKVLEVFKSPELANADKQAEAEKERVRADQEVAADLIKADADMKTWLAGKNINAVKIGKGTYVVVKEPGAGMQADSGKFASVRYEGKKLSDGKVFESTLSPQARPYTFKVGTGGAIPGWDEALPMFKKGGKGTLYVPGPLAYGRNPNPNSTFKINEALIFDIEVVDVSDTEPAQPRQELPPQIREQLEKQQQQQQHMEDSMKKAKH